MIRINLAPARSKRSKSSTPSIPTGGGAAWAVIMLVGWFSLIGVGYWLVTVEQDATEAVRKQTASTNKKVEQVKQDIDEEGLKKKEDQGKQMDVAIQKLKAQRRTPVFVMYELAQILTDAKSGGGPDIDQAKHRQAVTEDPQSEINERWDPTGLWISKVEEVGGVLSIDGAARDASDVSEFSRRLTASSRFGDRSHPNFKAVDKSGAGNNTRHLEWKLSVKVRRWD